MYNENNQTLYFIKFFHLYVYLNFIGVTQYIKKIIMHMEGKFYLRNHFYFTSNVLASKQIDKNFWTSLLSLVSHLYARHNFSCIDSF